MWFLRISFEQDVLSLLTPQDADSGTIHSLAALIRSRGQNHSFLERKSIYFFPKVNKSVFIVRVVIFLLPCSLLLSTMRFRMSTQKLYLFRCSVWMIAGLLYASGLAAQFLTEALPDQDIGRPARAPFITFLGIVTPGKLVTDPSLPPVGPVAQTLYEELRAHETPAGPAGEVMTSITSTWDEAGRVIEVVRKDHGSESDTINRYDGNRLVSQESTFPNSKQPRPKSWNYWAYDKSGKLIEYRRGSGDQIQNHDTNFKRDAEGRMTSYEVRQGPKDELFSRTELSYSPDGKTVDFNEYDAAGAVTQSLTQTVDDQGHVVMAVIRDRDWKTKQMKAPLRVAFRYD